MGGIDDHGPTAGIEVRGNREKGEKFWRSGEAFSTIAGGTQHVRAEQPRESVAIVWEPCVLLRRV